MTRVKTSDGYETWVTDAGLAGVQLDVDETPENLHIVLTDFGDTADRDFNRDARQLILIDMMRSNPEFSANLIRRQMASSGDVKATASGDIELAGSLVRIGIKYYFE